MRAVFRSRIRLIGLLASLLVPTVTRTAHADRCADDPHACAVDLFATGRKVLEAGDWAAAIPLFEKSIDQLPTVGARLNLGDCYVKAKEPWNAYVQYQAAAQLALESHDEVRRVAATASAAGLEPRVVRIRLLTADARAAAVRLDGVAVSAAELALLREGAYAVAPSKEHTLEVLPEHGAPWTGTVSGDAGVTRAVRAVFVATSAPVFEAPAPGRSSSSSTASPGAGTRMAGIVVGGVGVAGVVTGTVLALVGMSDANHVRSLCNANGGSYPGSATAPCGGVPGTDTPTQMTIRSANDAASTAALGSTIAFAAGGTLLAAGVILYVTAPRGTTVTVAPAVGQKGMGVQLGGAF